MQNYEYLGPKKYECQFDITEGIKKYYPHVLKKTLKAADCDCGECDKEACTCKCHASHR